MSSTFASFHLTIAAPHGDRYPVTARTQAGHEVSEALLLPLDNPTLTAYQMALDYHTPIDESVVIAVGQLLYQTLFQGTIAEAFATARTHADQQKVALRIHLAIDTDTRLSTAAALPWELMASAAGRPLMLEHALVRTFSWNDPIPDLGIPPGERIRLAVTSALPTELANHPIAAETEVAIIRAAITHSARPIDLIEVPHLTRDRLTNLLTNQRPHIVHHIGHGSIQRGMGYLDIERADQSRDRLSAREFSSMLHQSGVQLVVLNACHTSSAGESLLTSFAPIFMTDRIPAAIGMQAAILNRTGHCFANAFYAALGNSGSIDTSLIAARKAILADGHEHGAWGFPTLYSRVPHGHLWNATTLNSLVAAIHRTSAILQVYPDTVAGQYIERAEVQTITQWIIEAPTEERLGMLLDQPGSGKTVVLQQVLKQLAQAGVCVLVIKADTLRGIRSSADLATSLNLPESIETIAKTLTPQRLVVMIDQIDALSLTLARDQGTLDVILDTIARLRQMPHVRMISSCRTFDLNNHPRLAGIKVDQKFVLAPLNQDQITTLLNSLAIGSAHFLPAHWELLKVPLHLSVYVQLIQNSHNQQPNQFQSLQDLYSALWSRHIDHATPEIHTSDVTKAIYRLVDMMQSVQQIVIPLGVLDEYPLALRYLLHTGLLQKTQTNLTFFHQTFFDYCYARRFAASSQSLSATILAGSQGLFERSQMVQVLAYLRGSNPRIYLRELKNLFKADSLRPHLRQLLLQWFGNLSAPSDDELAIVRRWSNDPDQLGQFFDYASQNLDWFKLLDQENVLRGLIQSQNPPKIDLGLNFLYQFINQQTETVLGYIKPYLDTNAEWDARIIGGFTHIRYWNNETALTIFCRFLEQGTIDGTYLYDLASNPQFACRALSVYLEQRLNTLAQASNQLEENPLIQSTAINYELSADLEHYFFGEHAVGEIIRQATTHDPMAVVEYVLPSILKITDLFENKTFIAESYPSSSMSTYWYGESGPNDGGMFTLLIAQSLRACAQGHKHLFERIAAELVTHETLAAQRILVYAYMADPEYYRNAIVEYLLADQRCLKIGEPWENPYYESCMLYGSIVPWISTEQRRTLEARILAFYPVSEHINRQLYGITQLRFLKAVLPKYLSDEARQRRQELERKFPEFRLQPPRGIRSIGIGSPIPPDRVERMSDADLFKAMQHYDESTGWGGIRERPLEGGAVEFSRLIETKAKTDPDRFVGFLGSYGLKLESIYLCAILTGLAESAIASEFIFSLIQRYATLVKGRSRIDISRILAKRANEAVPIDLIELLKDWALNDPDPEPEALNGSATENPSHRDALNQGINSVRGTAIEAFCLCGMGQTAFSNEAIFESVSLATNDPSTAVQACIVYSLDKIMHLNPERTIELLVKILTHYPPLLESSVTHNLIYRSLYRFFTHIRPFIEQLLEHEHDQSRRVGAQLVCLAALNNPATLDLAQRCMGGDTALRQGAAQVYAHNIINEAYFEVCLERLMSLINDPAIDVRKAASECFEQLNLEHLDPSRNLIETMLQSPALIDGAYSLIKYLKLIAIEDVDLALRATKTIITQFGADQTSNSFQQRRIAREWVNIPLNVYLHTDDESIKEQAMDLFEKSIINQPWIAKQMLTDWDRR
ncbi:CHAT domain-containing protein [Herpetosiphon llansteffanensis]|uniref:CHAT domain-containing protein n=1 Tax=Herpetosiphon llansteffanensis TaxID=2094568 RepID=UPI001F0B9977|nr:CHAT domain-containing protein [Herpetosiphon llansteffanensis]